LRTTMDAKLISSGMDKLAVFDSVAPAATFTTNDGLQDISEAVTVEVARGYTHGGDVGRVYRYIGANESGVNLGTQNYNDTARWLRLDKLKLTILVPGKSWQLVAPDGATFVLELTKAGTISVSRNTINAVAVAASAAVGIGSGSGFALSGAGAVAQNVILSRTNAYGPGSLLHHRHHAT